MKTKFHMEQADRSHFEKEWEHAFADARMTPPDKVWKGIDRSLHGGNGNAKRLLLIQLAMAASVLFAMSIGAAGVYQLFLKTSDTSEIVANHEPNQESQQPSVIDESTSDGQEYLPLGQEKNTQQESISSGIVSGQTAQKPLNLIERAGALAFSEDESNNSGFPVLSGPVQSSFSDELVVPDPFGSSLVYEADLPEIAPTGVPYVITTPKKYRGHGWAALGVSAGNFSSGTTSNDMYTLAAYNDNTNSVAVGRVSEDTKGSVFQLEMNVGKQIAPKWIIQGGVGYMERNTAGTSNIVSARGDAMSNLSSESFASALVGEPYELENSLQMITVPLQVGYILLDNKVGVRLLTGIANEIMLKYQVQDSDGNLSRQAYKPGDTDEYQAYGLSALLSTEINYTIAERYQLALRPQVRQSLISLRDADGTLPRSLELGFAMRYQFE